MKNYNLVIKIPIELYESEEEQSDIHKDIEDLYNSDKHILIDLIENILIIDKSEYKVTIEKNKNEVKPN